MFIDEQTLTKPEDVCVSRNIIEALNARDPNAADWINRKAYEYENPQFKGRIGRFREIASGSLDMLYFVRLATNGATGGLLHKVIGEPKYQDDDFSLDDFFKGKADAHRFAVLAYMQAHGISVDDLGISRGDRQTLQSIRYPQADLIIP